MAGDDRRRRGQRGYGTVPGPAPRLYQRAFSILASQIENGAIAPGSRLRESSIAAQFGISRAPARQALAELERSGLVAKAPGRGYTVNAAARGLQDFPAAETVREGVRLFSSPSWEQIYGDVEDEIIARISFASWRINETELARHYGVSRTVARDVLGRLQQRGVVRKDDRSRWYAPALTPDNIEELYELRWLLEPTALAKAAPNVAPAFLAEMRHNLDSAIKNDAADGSVLDKLEDEMHAALLGHCRNRTLMQAITLHQSLLVAHRFLYRWTPRLFQPEPFLAEHLEILNQLEKGRIAEAARALETHLRVSRDRAIARVDVIVRAFTPDEIPYLEMLN